MSLALTLQQWMSLALEANYKAIAEEEAGSVQQEYEEELTSRQNNDIEILRLKAELQEAVASLDAVEALRAKVRSNISISQKNTNRWLLMLLASTYPTYPARR